MYNDIKKNKIESGIIITLFTLMITLIIYYICYAFKLGTYSIFIALSASILSSFLSYYNCDKIVLASNNARPATPEENKILIDILDELMISSGLTNRPKLYVMDELQPNAFATGRDPEHSVICVTTGLLKTLNRYELEGVIGHELGHVKNYDIKLSAIVSIMLGLVVMLSDMFLRGSFFRRSHDDDNKGNAILMIIGLFCLILAPIFGKLMQLAISRKREFAADATAVEFTRNPDAFISALEKISSDNHNLNSANKATENMYFSNPFKNKDISNLFSTHPTIEARIEAIKKLK